DRVLHRPQRRRHRLVDNSHRRTASAIVGGEHAAANNARADGPEVVRGDDAQEWPTTLELRDAVPPRDPNVIAKAARERKSDCQTHRLDVWQLTETFHHQRVERRTA